MSSLSTTRPELDILILGPIPPPFGGIAVHVDRLVPLLENAGLRVGVLNHFGSTDKPFVLGALRRNPLNYYRLPKKIPARVLHYHHSHWLAFMALALARRQSRSRYVITLHGTALARRLNSRAPLLGRLTRWGLRRFDAIIVVNRHIHDAIEGHVDIDEISVLPAFIKPPAEEPPYDPSIETFLFSGPTLLVPVYRVQFLPDGRDLYGLDTAADAFSALAEDRPELKLALFIAERPRGRKASDYLARIIYRLEQASLKSRVLVVFGLSLMPAFRHDVIVVRPTRSEGDALSVREAISARVPVVASDAVTRPSGTMTFSTDDSRDLYRVLRILLDTPKVRPGEPVDLVDEEASSAQFLSSLIRIYRAQMETNQQAH
jgi:glycosyltransferase involved in cell wall biosynthesis